MCNSCQCESTICISFQIYIKIGLELHLLYCLFRIIEHIGTTRRNIEAEVKDVLKLCRWERLMPIDNLKRIRQKIRKLVQKYTVSEFLSVNFSLSLLFILFILSNLRIVLRII